VIKILVPSAAALEASDAAQRLRLAEQRLAAVLSDLSDLHRALERSEVASLAISGRAEINVVAAGVDPVREERPRPRVQIRWTDGSWVADDLALPGSPPVGRGRTPGEALGYWMLHHPEVTRAFFDIHQEAER
jgi:hypothetical protein